MGEYGAGTPYEKWELELMTTYQLREICRHRKIMNGILSPLDKEELIRAILRSYGKKEEFLIKEEAADGEERLEKYLKQTNVNIKQEDGLWCNSVIVAYNGLSIGYKDGYILPYREKLAGTNALVVDDDFKICTILNIQERKGDKERLYLTKAAGIRVLEAERKQYFLVCAQAYTSKLWYHIYYGKETILPEHMDIYRIPIVDFVVKEPVRVSLPMAIDFGSVNTTAGVYLDTPYFESIGHDAQVFGYKENEVNYTLFKNGEEDTVLLPSVVGVTEVEGEDYRLVFGYDAIKLASASYVDEGFCVFYDIKRWIGEYDKKEELVDRMGRRAFVARADILRRFFLYIIHETEDCFKCRIDRIHISSPVKQKYRFQKMFEAILPEYGINQEAMLDEGMSVLYHTISGLIENGSAAEDESYEALIIDCGGGTTDLCSYRFRINNDRVAYRVRMETTYENGDTDFGGNNLTYRIMQILKIALVHAVGNGTVSGVKDVLERMDIDTYRFVDEHGTAACYHILDQEYEKAEKTLPTRFAEYEHYNRTDYFKVRNNFYTLFAAAEEMKKQFYSRVGALEITVGCQKDDGMEKYVPVDKWKLSFLENGSLNVRKEIPELTFNIFEIELLLQGEIYGIIHKFMEEMYQDGRIGRFSFIKLTGQSCKIDLFKDALKEFVPGKMIQFRKRAHTDAADYELKMTCVDGALKFMRDKHCGFADIHLDAGRAVLPYRVTAYTHMGREVVLIDGFGDWERAGTISRNMEELTLQMYLKDEEGRERYRFSYSCRQEDFEQKKYEEIQRIYGGHIRQKETDSIENGEVKFFVWANQEEWGYQVVPVFCKEDELYLGKEMFYGFENEHWLNSFYDGMK